MVSYFRPNDFEQSLQSILNNTVEPFSLSIIDNSHGGLDNILRKYENNHNISIYRNSSNIGKGRGIMKWYNHIMKSSEHDHFISIDADIKVYPKWLTRLTEARRKISTPFAMIAPTIMNNYGEWFNIQLKTGMIMHNPKNMYNIIDEVYYNRYTAGPLLLIDRNFFENIGGYSQDQLYGSDDGKLCKAAENAGRFVGIASNVHVLHLRQDEEIGYQKWKKEHINTDGACIGYWDRN